MTLKEIYNETSIATLKAWKVDCDFWAWNAEAEGSKKAASLWNTRKDACSNRIIQLKGL